jgi:mannose-6-phosphate isomerase-like protein (cupin superfamily)
VKRLVVCIVVLLSQGLWLAPPAAAAQQKFVIKRLAEKKVAELPAGPLYWRIEKYSTLDQARDAAGPWSLVAESSGSVWLFTLGAAGETSSGGAKVAEVGPIHRLVAPQYLLRINEASGAPGSVTSVHSHPGTEAFYVLSGEQSIRGPNGTMHVKVGEPAVGGSEAPMQVSSSGQTDLRALVMFVVDATRPFSSPAKFGPH